MSEKKNIQALTGNYAAAYGAALCKPDVIAAYPITPQSSVVECLASMVANGEIDSDMIQVECEHSSMSAVQGAVAAGGRAFTATAAQGLALMYEPYIRMSTMRFPLVMALATREMCSPGTVWSGQQDAMCVRDAGWIQMFCDSNQEILDMIIQGYMISEHPDVRIPMNVCYDGFYSSHLTEGVDIPPQETVDAFLPRTVIPEYVLHPDHPMAMDPMTPGPLLMHYRKSHLDGMEKALEVIEETDRKFSETFGRSYGGLIEEYRNDDAEVTIITIGGMSGTGKDAVDIAREAGIRAGLIRLRFTRPFPEKRIREALAGKKAFAVIDRSCCFGWRTGPMYMEVCAAVANAKEDYYNFSVIGGLGGADIPLNHILGTIRRLDACKEQHGAGETEWYFTD